MKHAPAAIPELLRPLLAQADRVDRWTVAGDAGLTPFLQVLFRSRPWWLRLLLFMRSGTVRALGMRSLRPEPGPRSGEIAFAPGARVWIYRVLAAEPDRFWIGEAETAHISSVFAVARRAAPDPGVTVWSVLRFRTRRARLYMTIAGAVRHAAVAALLRRAARTRS